MSGLLANYNAAYKLFIRIKLMKKLSLFLLAVCFSSIVCAENKSPFYKVGFIFGFKGGLGHSCVRSFKAGADKNNYTLSDQEINSLVKRCACIADKIIEKAGGEDFILNNDNNSIKEKFRTIMSDKNQMMPILVKECPSVVVRI